MELSKEQLLEAVAALQARNGTGPSLPAASSVGEAGPAEDLGPADPVFRPWAWRQAGSVGAAGSRMRWCRPAWSAGRPQL